VLDHLGYFNYKIFWPAFEITPTSLEFAGKTLKYVEKPRFGDLVTLAISIGGRRWVPLHEGVFLIADRKGEARIFNKLGPGLPYRINTASWYYDMVRKRVKARLKPQLVTQLMQKIFHHRLEQR